MIEDVSRLRSLQLPKILLPEQEDELKSTIANVDELITDEVAALAKEKEESTVTAARNRERIAELSLKLGDLKKQVKPLEIKGRAAREGTTDEMGRTRRESRRESESMQVDEAEKEPEPSFQVRGENGDVEVEY